MERRVITQNMVNSFKEYLYNEERSDNTIEKYIRDISAFVSWLGERELCKPALIEYKKYLCDEYAPKSVNSMLSALNALFVFLSWHDLRVKALKIQRQVFADKKRELTKCEYERLVSAAGKRKDKRLYYLIQTICSTGIRISELCYITVDAIKLGYAKISCKGKIRKVFLPRQLCKMLTAYTKKKDIKSGSVFITRNGNAVNRSNIWHELKRLCRASGVEKGKVFPHNLRHLFAKTYYSVQKDIVRLADILGHSNINTTRIYTMENGDTHQRQIQKLGLLVC